MNCIFGNYYYEIKVFSDFKVVSFKYGVYQKNHFLLLMKKMITRCVFNLVLFSIHELGVGRNSKQAQYVV